MSAISQLAETEKRAYIILSRLFLDTEMTLEEIDNIASSLRPLGIPTATLDKMLRRDLFSTLHPNLLGVTGVWEGFDENWFLQQVQDKRTTDFGWAKNVSDSVA